MLTTFEDLAAEVAHYRTEYAKHKAALDALYQAWLTETQPLGDAVSELKDLLADAESRLREAALNTYTATGEKKFSCGIGIRVTTKLAYDEAQALEWAKSHGLALKLDAKSFEKIAKADPNSLTLTYTGEVVNIVQVVEVPTVTLPTDTAKLLEA